MESMRVGTKEKRVLTDILQKYREMNHLWDKSHPDYKDRRKRNNSMAVLLELYKTLEERATMWVLKKKIDNMRATYYREMKKVINSRIPAPGFDVYEEYVPTLWYFELLTFLGVSGEPSNQDSQNTNTQVESGENSQAFYNSEGDQSPLPTRTDLSSSSSEKTCEVPLSEDTESNKTSQALHQYKQRNYEHRVHHNKMRNQSKKSKVDDECQTQGKLIAAQLKNVTQEQFAIVQKVISEAIFYAKTDKLTGNSRVRLE